MPVRHLKVFRTPSHDHSAAQVSEENIEGDEE
jgi:hypothetical protein